MDDLTRLMKRIGGLDAAWAVGAWAVGSAVFPAAILATQRFVFAPLRIAAHMRLLATICGAGSVVGAASIFAAESSRAVYSLGSHFKAESATHPAPDRMRASMFSGDALTRERWTVYAVAGTVRNHALLPGWPATGSCGGAFPAP